MIGWKNTRNALERLEGLLTCKVCDSLISDPCSLERCDHIFCRGCIEKLVGVDSKCPECGTFAWVKDMKTNRQLANTVAMCAKMRMLLGSDDDINSDDDNDDDELRINDISPTDTRGVVWEETQHRFEPEADSYQFSSPDIITMTDSSNKCAAAIQEVSRNHKKAFKDQRCRTKSRASVKEQQETDEPSLSNCYDILGGTSQSGKDVKKVLSCQDGKLVSSKEDILGKGNALDSGHPKLSRRLPVKEKCFGGQIAKATRGKKKLAVSEMPVSNCDDQEVENAEQNDHWMEEDVNHLHFGEQSKDEYDVESEKENLSETFFTRVKSREDQCGETFGENEDLGSICTTRAQKRKLQQVQMQLSAKELPQKELRESSNSMTGQRPTCMKDKKKKAKENSSETPVKQGMSKRTTAVQNFCSPQTSTSSFSGIKRNIRGETPLHVAAIKGCAESVRTLLTEGADPNTKDHAGWTPLHEASNHGYLSIVELLLDHGAMIDTPGGFDHDTPLHDAVTNGRLEVAKLLVTRGAPRDIRNKRGLIPTDYATTEEMRTILSISTSKTDDSQGSAQQLIASLPESRKFSLDSPKILLATGLSSDQKANLQTCAVTLDAKIVYEFSLSVTHIITAANAKGICPRTIKYLSGVLTGKWIVSYDWVVKCLRRKTWVDESPYEVKGTNDAAVDAPKKARINAVKQLPSLFDGCEFFFYGESHPPHPAKEDLIQMIRYGGGKILSREPKPRVDETLCLPTSSKANKVPAQAVTLAPVAYHANPESKLYRCTQYVIYDAFAERKPHIWDTESLRTLPLTWLMDCASNFAILDSE
ncbi:BRCA1-associated RING domain protein 1-like [Montipora foliosa]|uniref:BRCA1-associated RING domain protein 1-like n=1 Tax=Montipora foliosa TaxID=591990 RepID=UPI0035F1EDEC